MDGVASKKIQVIIIACYLFSTVFSASLLGIDFSAPKKVIKTGVDEITQAFTPRNNQQQTNFSADSNTSNQLSYKNNSYVNQKRGPFKTKPIKMVEKFRFIPPLRPTPINKLTQEIIQTTSQTPAKVDNRGSYYNKNEFVTFNCTEDSDRIKDVSELFDGSYTNGWSDNGTDFTTETSNYETTTNEPLNRIGGVPPGVVASLLGGG